MERGTPTDGNTTEQARKRAYESRTGMLVFMMLGRFMVELAAKNEPDPRVRRFRRSQLLNEWSRYTGRVVARAAT